MRICLFEDRRASDLAPLTLTRPVFDLLCGLTPLADKPAHYFAADAVGFLVRPLVADLTREHHPHAPVNDPLWLRAGPTVLVNARWLPPARPDGQRAPTTRELFDDGPFLAVCDGELAFAAVGPELLAGVSPAALDDCLEDWLTALPRQEVGGCVVRRPWDLVDRNGRQIVADFPWAVADELYGSRPLGVALVGPADRLFVDPSALVDPMVVIDTSGGPVVIDAGAVVGAFSHLAGPCYVGPGTHILGGRVKPGTSLGPHCRIGGEVEASVVLGYSNKAHDGFLGHSYVGEWVNLAAGTQASNLRTDYGPVAVPADGGHLNTGRLKVGCFVGDHAKTGLGVLLNCGSVVGAFASVLPTGRLAPRDVPPFTRFGPDGLAEEPNLDALLATADAMMKRRGRSLSRAQEAVYRAAAAQTAAHRRRALAGGDPARQQRRAS
jgi:UDP-N-acetylglucosamine diphosphorylase/glucosamine-1-phosphate N-acetyltransferase